MIVEDVDGAGGCGGWSSVVRGCTGACCICSAPRCEVVLMIRPELATSVLGLVTAGGESETGWWGSESELSSERFCETPVRAEVTWPVTSPAIALEFVVPSESLVVIAGEEGSLPGDVEAVEEWVCLLMSVEGKERSASPLTFVHFNYSVSLRSRIGLIFPVLIRDCLLLSRTRLWCRLGPPKCNFI